MTIRIGTRTSPLALAQANETAHLLQALGAKTTLVEIKTTGDILLSESLQNAGGKGLFTKEIDQKQLAGEIDIAVHSTKDLPTQLPEGLILWGYLPREDPRDALVSLNNKNLSELKQNAKIGSASLRRSAMLKNLRPDFEVSLLRGNVNSRLKKLEAGAFDATLLAAAGLKRLGFENKISQYLDVEHFVPAPGQGAIALVINQKELNTFKKYTSILCKNTLVCVSAERAFLATLEGSCRTAIGAHAKLIDNAIHLSGVIYSPSGEEKFTITGTTPASLEKGISLGQKLAQTVRSNAPHLLPT